MSTVGQYEAHDAVPVILRALRGEFFSPDHIPDWRVLYLARS
jgi:hypothetical protein